MPRHISRYDLDWTYRTVSTDAFFQGTTWTVSYNHEDDPDIQEGFSMIYVYNPSTRTKLDWSREWIY